MSEPIREGLAAAVAECRSALGKYRDVVSRMVGPAGGIGDLQWTNEARAAVVTLKDRVEELLRSYSDLSPEENALVQAMRQEIAAKIAENQARIDAWKRGQG